MRKGNDETSCWNGDRDTIDSEKVKRTLDRNCGTEVLLIGEKTDNRVQHVLHFYTLSRIITLTVYLLRWALRIWLSIESLRFNNIRERMSISDASLFSGAECISFTRCSLLKPLFDRGNECIPSVVPSLCENKKNHPSHSLKRAKEIEGRRRNRRESGYGKRRGIL